MYGGQVSEIVFHPYEWCVTVHELLEFMLPSNLWKNSRICTNKMHDAWLETVYLYPFTLKLKLISVLLLNYKKLSIHCAKEKKTFQCTILILIAMITLMLLASLLMRQMAGNIPVDLFTSRALASDLNNLCSISDHLCSSKVLHILCNHVYL